MLSEKLDTESTSRLVSLLLGHGIHVSDICNSVHYHASKECIQLKNPRFRSTQVVVPDELKGKVTSPIYQSLFIQEFGCSFS